MVYFFLYFNSNFSGDVIKPYANYTALILTILYFALVAVIWLASRLRNRLFYDIQSFYFFKHVGDKPLHGLVYTTENSIYHLNPYVCRITEISDHLNVEFTFEKRVYTTSIRWRDVISISFGKGRIESNQRKLED